MRNTAMIVVTVVCLLAFATGPSVAAEFYVVKSRSGVLMVRDHKPSGSATIVKGPFKTGQEAEQALKKGSIGGPEWKGTNK